MPDLPARCQPVPAAPGAEGQAVKTTRAYTVAVQRFAAAHLAGQAGQD